MDKGFYGKHFIFSRFIYRVCTARHHVRGSEDKPSPVIYVAHHQNMYGPLSVMGWFERPVHCMIYHVFCDKKSCFDQFYGYTFTKRLGWPKLPAFIISWLACHFVPRLSRSMRAIPAYRGSRDVMKTANEGVAALLKGESLLIFPDIDYASDDDAMGEMYRGFLHFDKYYYKRTGRHVPFIPLYVSETKKEIVIGDSISFREEDFNRERDKIYLALRDSINNLADSCN